MKRLVSAVIIGYFVWKRFSMTEASLFTEAGSTRCPPLPRRTGMVHGGAVAFTSGQVIA
jgi:hypothetical protein